MEEEANPESEIGLKEIQDLLKEGYKNEGITVEVVERKEHKIPKIEDFNKFEEDTKSVELAAKHLAGYLKRPILTDDLANHGRRREIREKVNNNIREDKGKEIADKVDAYYRSNALKRNSFSVVVAYVYLAKKYLPESIFEKLDKVSEKIVQKGPEDDPWDNNTTPISEKVRIIEEEVSPICVDALKALSDYKPTT